MGIIIPHNGAAYQFHLEFYSDTKYSVLRIAMIGDIDLSSMKVRCISSGWMVIKLRRLCNLEIGRAHV